MGSGTIAGVGDGGAAEFWARQEGESHFVAGMYLSAKAAVVEAGYGHEIEWQRTRRLDELNEGVFLQEAAWVILSAGLGVATVARVFPRLVSAFNGLTSAAAIVSDRRNTRRRALRVFAHPGKINAIFSATSWCAELGIEVVVSRLSREGPKALDGLPFLGPATSMHLAKNLGVLVSKPDRHLERIAGALPFGDVSALCSRIGILVGESPAVVDLVLWRACVLGALRAY